MEFFKPRVSRKTLTTFESLGDLFAKTLEGALQPPRRLTVSEWAAMPEEGRYINQPGAYVGPWKNETVPYMVEPMDTLTDPAYTAAIFAGPAQCAKTDALIVNPIGYSATSDPMDMLVVCPTHAAARDFSIRRVDRLHRHSKAVGAAVLKAKDADNRTDKQYANGMMLSLAHPSISELAGRPIGRVSLTDYDRMDDDIDGEGSPFDLASKRTTTFGSFAMTLAESSPSRDVVDPKHICQGNEAPPCGGILALYNRGDRRRWNWPCPDCGSYFEGLWEHLEWDAMESNLDSAATVRMICPHCSYAITPSERFKMNVNGAWLKEGQTIDDDGMIEGAGRRSNIASFWLRGVAAGLTNWAKLVKSYLDAEDDFQSNGSEEALKKFYNTDLGEPYIAKRDLADTTRTAEMLMEHAYSLPYVENEDGEDRAVLRLTNNQAPKYIEPLVPEHVRALIGLVDVQQNMFIVQIVGISEGQPADLTVIDRFSIRNSERPDEHSGGFEWVKPGSYEYDWDKIEEQVIRRTYRLASDETKKMAVKMTFCDSGGKAGVTTNAYAFVRTLRKRGLGGRFHLVKGASQPSAPRTQISYPDNSKRGGGAKAGAQGDVPVLMLNPTLLKDALDNRLNVVAPGFGMIHFPNWLPDWFFGELVAEQRDVKKGWQNGNKRRNEAWDLLYYAIGGCASALLGVEKVDWKNPPLWLRPPEGNPLVIAAEREEAFEQRARIDFSKFGRELA
jgi:phage terminase large subunit GpA-like protein